MSRAALLDVGRQSRTVVFPHPDPDKDDIEVRIRGVSAGDSRALLTMDESDADARYEAFLQILAAGILDEDGSQAFHMPGDRKHLEDLPSEIALRLSREIRVLSGLSDPAPPETDPDPTPA